MQADEARELAREWLSKYGSDPFSPGALEALLARHALEARVAAYEEIAQFAETHYCIIDENSPGGYKTCERKKHPNEPFALAIRSLAERASKGERP